MKLALVIGSLGGGGAERVMVTLANAWVQRGVAVTLITLADATCDKYTLDPAVERVSLNLVSASQHWWQGLANNVRRVRALRATLRALAPDGVLSFLTSTNVLSILAARPLGIPVVVSERSSSSYPTTPIWRLLRILVYRRAAAIVSQTQRGAGWFKTRVPTVPIHAIPNPVQVVVAEAPDAIARRVLGSCQGESFMVAVGRLAHEKGYDILLRAFAQITLEHLGWRLVILGEGPERERLEAMSSELGIADRVLLPGFTSTPHALLRRARLFVLSSRYEGFPNALLEAMACGLPCVAADCPTGPAELIEHGTNGLLVPTGDIDALAAVMARAMDDVSLRERLGRAARESVAVYSLDSVLGQWQALFEACGISHNVVKEGYGDQHDLRSAV